jgi:putative phosphoribosyl transferase
MKPKRIVIATPVAPSSAQDQLKAVADEFVCVLSPDWFFGISEFYQNFGQTEDSEVRNLLDRATESLLTPPQRKDVSHD